MRYLIFSGALLAAVAFGSPVKRALVTELDIVTEYVTVTVDQYAPLTTDTPVTQSSISQDVNTVHVVVEVHQSDPPPAPIPTSTSSGPDLVSTSSPDPTPTPPPTPPPAEVSTPAAAVEAAPTSSPPPNPSPAPAVFVSTPPPQNSQGDGSPMSGSATILSTLNKWRAAYKLPPYQWDSVLASNAAGTGQADDGVNLVHSGLAPNSAQNIAPGVDSTVGNPQGLTPFEIALVVWLCEDPNDPELAGTCSKLGSLSAGLPETMTYSFNGETGHHDNFVADYGFAGCAYTSSSNPSPQSIWQGLWVCNFAKDAQT